MWLKEAKPTIDFESDAVRVNGLHALPQTVRCGDKIRYQRQRDVCRSTSLHRKFPDTIWLIGRRVKIFTDHAESLSTLLRGSNVMYDGGIITGS